METLTPTPPERSFAAKTSDSLERFFNGIAPYKMAVQRTMLFLAILGLVLSIFFWKPLFLYAIVLALMAYGFITFTKPLGDATKAKAQYRVFYFTITILFALIVVSMLSMLSVSFLKVAGLILPLVILFIGWLLYRESLNNETYEKFMSESVYKKFKEGDQKTGDIVLGKSKADGKKVILPYKDRFLHMLILGATGTGKTSQMILPMINQDIQNKEMGVIVLEPKGDLANQVAAMAKLYGRSDVTYFDPTEPDCPYFNPFMGEEADVVENISSAFGAMDSTESTYFRDTNENLLRNSVKTIKRLYGDRATLDDLLDLMTNQNGKGNKMLVELQKMGSDDPRILDENEKIAAYFLNDYYTGLKAEKGASKTYQDSSGVRNQIQKMVSNHYVARVLNPPKDRDLKPGEYIDFERILREGGILCMCSAQGKLREMGSYIGYFLILTLESFIFRREGNEFNRRGCSLYIDEFQKYANPGFEDVLTQGRSYRVAAILATQNRAEIAGDGGQKGRKFQKVVDSNARNVILLPGSSADDTKYYSEAFGEEEVEKVRKTRSGPAYVPRLFSLADQKESEATEITTKPKFSSSELIYKPFGTVIARIIVNNNIQFPQEVQVEFVPRPVQNKINEILAEMEAESKRKKAEANKPAEKPFEDDVFIVGGDDEEVFDLNSQWEYKMPETPQKTTAKSANVTTYDAEDEMIDEIPFE